MKRNVFFILALSFIMQTVMGYGSSIVVSQNEAYALAKRFVVNHTLPSYAFQVNENPVFLQDGENIAAYLFKVSPIGFVVVSANNLEQPIIAYSLQNNFALPESEEEATALTLIYGISRNDQKIQGNINKLITHIDEFEIGPFVQSLWGQVNCYDNNGNLVNVSNYYTPNHYAPGCVAISMATLMHHYEWPINGTGSHTYTDNWGSSTGTYSADFEETYYSWINMLDRYKNKPSTDWQREAVGMLVFQTAIALEMDFEYNGSTSNVNRIPASGKNYFRFSSMKRQFDSPVFWQLLDSNMVHEIPVVLAIKANNGYGHSIVCDGLRIEEDEPYYYHLNNGWWGSANGWYRIRDGHLGGGYDYITDGIFYFLPIPMLSTPIVSESSEVVTLNWQYAKTELTIDAYELQQKIDNGAWETITNDIQDTTYDVEVNLSQTYTFRVRAKVEGRWSTESWSTEEQMSYLAVNEIAELDKISFGPNPLNNHLQLKIPTMVSSPVKISIVTMEGKNVYTLNNNKYSTVLIDTHIWNPGVYLMIIKNEANNRVVKLVKK